MMNSRHGCSRCAQHLRWDSTMPGCPPTLSCPTFSCTAPFTITTTITTTTTLSCLQLERLMKQHDASSADELLELAERQASRGEARVEGQRWGRGHEAGKVWPHRDCPPLRHLSSVVALSPPTRPACFGLLLPASAPSRPSLSSTLPFLSVPCFNICRPAPHCMLHPALNCCLPHLAALVHPAPPCCLQGAALDLWFQLEGQREELEARAARLQSRVQQQAVELRCGRQAEV